MLCAVQRAAQSLVRVLALACRVHIRKEICGFADRIRNAAGNGVFTKAPPAIGELSLASVGQQEVEAAAFDLRQHQNRGCVRRPHLPSRTRKAPA